MITYRRADAIRSHASRRRGSVLIFVVALLTLIALIGTALIATARIDRYNAVAHVETTTDTATHDRFTDQLREKVLRAIARGYGKDVDSARTDSWLGDRLPIPAQQKYYPAATAASDIAVWRFPSGIIDRYDADLAQPEYWRPPLQFDPTNPISLLNTANPANSLVKLDGTNVAAMVPDSVSITYPNDHPVEGIRGKTRTFPAGFFVNRTNGNLIAGAGTPTQPLLMGDADGDGIADALLFQLSAAPVDGVTYYGAIRVVDNNSAINVNTAWSRSTEFNAASLYTSAGLNPAALTHSNTGFFTSNIGLYELLDPSTSYKKLGTNTAEGGNRPARDNEMAELDEYRLGYTTAGINGTADAGGWVDAFEDFKNPGSRSDNTIQDMYVSHYVAGGKDRLVAVEDRTQDPGSSNSSFNPDPNGAPNQDSLGNFHNVNPQPDVRIRGDFFFTTQNEALATMASRRWESVRYGIDIRNNPKQTSDFYNAVPYNVDANFGSYFYAHNPSPFPSDWTQKEHALFPYRWLDEQEAASLAYRFCLIDPNGNKSTLDTILRHSAYRAAPNWKPTLSDSNPTWSFFPANEYLFWFQTLNFDGDTTADAPYTTNDSVTGAPYPKNISYVEDQTFADKNNPSSLANSNGSQPRFRSVRPLLTTHNPVNTSTVPDAFRDENEAGFQHGSTGSAFTGIDWNHDNTTGSAATEFTQLYPGMTLNDMETYPSGGSGSPAQYRSPQPWRSGTQYRLNDMVYDPATRITFMCIKDTTASVGKNPMSAAQNVDPATGEFLYWEPQPWVSGRNKTSVNVAGFPELWHAYFELMSGGNLPKGPLASGLAEDVSTINSSTIPTANNSDFPEFFPDPVSIVGQAASPPSTVAEAKNYRFLDPYRGMRFFITENLGRQMDTAGGTGKPLAPAGANSDPTFEPARYNLPENPGTLAAPNYEVNKLGMFRSVIRDPHIIRPNVTTFTDPNNPDALVNSGDDTKSSSNGSTLVNTVRGAAPLAPQERLTPFQMMTLRSAIAAFNTQDMLNTYGLRFNATAPATANDVPAKTVILYDINPELPNPTPNTAAGEAANSLPGPNDPRPQYEVTIYGNRPQPFITEVYANNDGNAYDFLDDNDQDTSITPDPGDPDLQKTKKRYQNSNGYVAIELYNPYPVNVTMNGWAITTFDRSASATSTFGTSTAVLGGATNTIIKIPNGTVIPANGSIVLESYDPSAVVKNPAFDPTKPDDKYYASREYRPPASGLLPLWDMDSNPPPATGATNAQWVNKADPTPGGAYFGPLPSGHKTLAPDPATPSVATLISVPDLRKLIPASGASGQEMIILRPRAAAGAAPPTTSLQLANMVPVDQFDFTGMDTVVTSGAARSIHYARPSGPWQMVYPGRYDGGRADPNKPAIGPRRQEGVWITPDVYTNGNKYDLTNNQPDPWTNPLYPDMLAYDPFAKITTKMAPATNFRYGAVSLGVPNTDATYPATSTFTIPLLGGPLPFNPLTDNSGASPFPLSPGQTTNAYPFGGFARNGDILQVPYIAAYRIRKLQSDTPPALPKPVNTGKLEFPPTATDCAILEMNSITMDAAMAEDTDPSNDGPANAESIGRFAPPVNGTLYAWCKNLFRYLDVHVPSNDYLPDTNPAFYPPGSQLTNALAADPYQLPKPVNNRPGFPNLSVDPDANLGSLAALQSQAPTDEGNTSTQGLININTAPAKVLSMLPLVPNAAGGVDPAKTEEVASIIFNYVTKTKDISSLFDLNNVKDPSTSKQFKDAAGALNAGTDFGNKQGDFYPYDGNGGPLTDKVIGDYKQQYLMMNRISNLVTTKSDTFTVYLLVQGWREAGTQFPVLDWEKRQAFIVDRSNGTLRITRVPTD